MNPGDAVVVRQARHVLDGKTVIFVCRWRRTGAGEWITVRDGVEMSDLRPEAVVAVEKA